MLRSALYYPHTRLRFADPGITRRLLKRALLLWDELKFIVPYPEYRFQYGSRSVSEAVELVGRYHYPSELEKERTHAAIEELVTRPSLPAVFYYRGGDDSFDVYPQKFLRETWNLLEHTRVAHPRREGEKQFVSTQAGLCIMALLADVCAGSALTRVTDRAQAYAALGGFLFDKDCDAPSDGATASAHERLVGLTAQVVDVDSLTLKQLIQLRKKEMGQKGRNYTDLRHRYLQRIEDHLKEVTQNPKLTLSDYGELERQFRQDMEVDLATLRKELRAELRATVYSKEIFFALIGASCVTAAALFGKPLPMRGVLNWDGVIVTVGGILGARNKFLKARADLLRRHPMAYLYEARGGPRL